MITPGWRRRNDTCPQCHMTGRVGQRAKDENDGSLMTFHYAGTLMMNVEVDICDNCGTLYAFKASAASE